MSAQPSLFDAIHLTDAGAKKVATRLTAGYAKDSDTSRRGAEHVNRTLSQRQQAVLRVLRERGPSTSGEVAEVLGLPLNAVSGRFTELSDSEHIVDTGERRRNPRGPRDTRKPVDATVWKVA